MFPEEIVTTLLPDDVSISNLTPPPQPSAEACTHLIHIISILRSLEDEELPS
jgi:hypothetical protein